MSQDFKKPQPSKTERMCFELFQELQATKKFAEATNQLLHALLAVMEGASQLDVAEVAKTFSNDMRQQSIRIKLMAAELELKEQKETSELILPK